MDEEGQENGRGGLSEVKLIKVILISFHFGAFMCTVKMWFCVLRPLIAANCHVDLVGG